MAVKKSAAPYSDLEDELQYSVKLLKPIQIGRSWRRSANRCRCASSPPPSAPTARVCRWAAGACG